MPAYERGLMPVTVIESEFGSVEVYPVIFEHGQLPEPESGIGPGFVLHSLEPIHRHETLQQQPPLELELLPVPWPALAPVDKRLTMNEPTINESMSRWIHTTKKYITRFR